ncbi:MAG: c-type cytochrome [Novosphingobium sp.]|nr:c-type cytochrome [Novosphingobium sp.]
MRALALIAIPLLAACQPAAQPLTPEQSAKLTPKDPRLAQLYAGSCKACHTVGDSQAPLTGDRTQWDPRWARGEDTLLTNSQVGFGGMPAGGQCFECSAEDLKALITFMAGREP